MSEKNLTQLLEQLHTELDNTEAVDEKGRDLLHALSADIQELLERSGDADESLLERLQESIDRFGEQHPALTTVLSHLLTALNNAGI
jgi:hypothetical protein